MNFKQQPNLGSRLHVRPEHLWRAYVLVISRWRCTLSARATLHAVPLHRRHQSRPCQSNNNKTKRKSWNAITILQVDWLATTISRAIIRGGPRCYKIILTTRHEGIKSVKRTTGENQFHCHAVWTYSRDLRCGVGGNSYRSVCLPVLPPPQTLPPVRHKINIFRIISSSLVMVVCCSAGIVGCSVCSGNGGENEPAAGQKYTLGTSGFGHYNSIIFFLGRFKVFDQIKIICLGRVETRYGTEQAIDFVSRLSRITGHAAVLIYTWWLVAGVLDLYDELPVLFYHPHSLATAE